MDSEKLDQFKAITETYVNDMNNIAIRYEEKSDDLQREYMDEAKTLVRELTKEMIDRTTQYVKEIQAILES